MTTLVEPARATDRVDRSRIVTVPMGGMNRARRHERLRTVGLGSCVAIIVFAPAQSMAALAHCLLPFRDDAYEPETKYADTAVPALVQLLSAGGATGPFAAALVGGASMFPGVAAGFMTDISAATVNAARAALALACIPIRVEDVGGHVGRSVIVDPVTQRVMVRTIRDGERWL